MKKNNFFLSLFLLPVIYSMLINYCNAKEYVLIVGGGPYLENSQSQIELNVKWASEVIRRNGPDKEITIFYSDGDNPEPDIVNYYNLPGKEAKYTPFDYVFGGVDLNIKEYYNHRISNIAGSTNKEFLKKELIKIFSKIKITDKVMFLYNGHGGYGGADRSNNYLRLWNDTKLSVYEFESLLSLIPEKTPVRFIMTQCFSGAFGNAVHSKARADTLAITGNRCGFMAESETRESEGCSASVTVDDYRDYTTYFFAALDGKTRLNQPLHRNPDTNGDRKISLYEAHLYTLENAYSTDLSRSTSEQYLEQWEPWYIRWLPRSEKAKESIYYSIAHRVANKYSYLNKTELKSDKLRAVRNSLLSNFIRLKKQDDILKTMIIDKQKNIVGILEKEYPKITKGYKNGFSTYSLKDIENIKIKITSHEEYNKLQELLKKKSTLTLPLLDAERKLTQAEKIARLIKLAKVESYFTIFSSTSRFVDLTKLLTCEKLSL